MKLTGWRLKFLLVLMLVMLTGCSLATPPPPLTATAVQQTLNAWNPTFCKVVKFYGFYQPGTNSGHTLVAYVSLVNPSDHLQKQTIFAARFQLLTRPDGQQQWYLTSLISHAAGLSRRQGWDNLMEPVTEAGDTGSR